MAETYFFDVYGVVVGIETHQHLKFLSEQLLADFSYFLVPGSACTPQVHIKISNDQKLTRENGVTWFKSALCRAVQDADVRRCLFYDGSILEDQGSEYRSATFWPSSTVAAYEALYYYFLSAVGEALDRKGIHRLHALAFTAGGAARCYPLHSKQGKTSRALCIISEPNQKVFGDEIIFTDGKQILPFPMRLAVRPDVYEKFSTVAAQPFQRSLGGLKYLVQIPAGQVAAASDSYSLLLMRNGYFTRVKFGFTFLLGLGVPQMREFMIRPNSLLSLGAIFARRFFCLSKLLQRSSVVTDKSLP